MSSSKLKNGAVTMNKLSDEVYDAINNASSAQTWVHVGFSSEEVNGSAGFGGMAQACQADFGPSSRITTTSEIVELTSFPAQTGRGWVRSTGDPDISGWEGIYTRNCNAFSTFQSSIRGLVVYGGTYQIGGWQCNTNSYVACSVAQ